MGKGKPDAEGYVVSGKSVRQVFEDLNEATALARKAAEVEARTGRFRRPDCD